MGLGSDAELDFILKDSGVAVSYGSAPVQSSYGHFDRGEVVAQGDSGAMEVVGRAQTFVIRDGSLTGLKQDTLITIAGSAYKIVDTGVPDTEGWRRLSVTEGAP